MSDRILEMLDAHIEYAEKTNNFNNVGNFTDIKEKIQELEMQLLDSLHLNAKLEKQFSDPDPENGIEKSNDGVCHEIKSENILTDKATGRVMAVFYNEYDLDHIIEKFEKRNIAINNAKDLSENYPVFLNWINHYADTDTSTFDRIQYSREDMRYAFQGGYETALKGTDD